ncbi:MAG: hypothetical protein ABH914_04020 [Candidatus Omnitrophota bacterium]
MNYPQAVKYLDSFINYEKIPQYPYKQFIKLERIKEFLAALNNPQKGFKIHSYRGHKG